MPITSVDVDRDAATMTVRADFEVPLERLWDGYADPRVLERFWGPPTYPAVFTRHDMCVDGQSAYSMTGPEGDVSSGYWVFRAVEPLQRIEVLDGFANPDGSAKADMPSMRMVMDFEATPTGSGIVVTTYFGSAAELDELLAMGMDEGMRAAMGQMDAVLPDDSLFPLGAPCAPQLLTDTKVRVSRVVRGGVDDVWRAHHDADLMPRWLLGPDGWTMAVCNVAEAVGDSYRYEWQQVDGPEHFGFTGELLEQVAPRRAVTTEQMIGMDGPGTVNELTLTPVAGGTLVSTVITYPSMELRDIILATGMTDGMEASYARLEREVLS